MRNAQLEAGLQCLLLHRHCEPVLRRGNPLFFYPKLLKKYAINHYLLILYLFFVPLSYGLPRRYAPRNDGENKHRCFGFVHA
jgi:hypothetical protein